MQPPKLPFLVQPAADAWYSEPLLTVLATEYFSTVEVDTRNIQHWDGSAWQLKQLKHWDGSAWVNAKLKHWDGASWVEV